MKYILILATFFLSSCSLFDKSSDSNPQGSNETKETMRDTSGTAYQKEKEVELNDKEHHL